MQNSNGKEGLHGKEKVADKQIKYGSEEKIVKSTIWSVALYAADLDTDKNLQEEVRSF